MVENFVRQKFIFVKSFLTKMISDEVDFRRKISAYITVAQFIISVPMKI